MILECPSCGTRYLVQIGLFAQGGRKVRCARCKHEWHVKLPTSVDIVPPISMFPPPEATPETSPPPLSSRPSVNWTNTAEAGGGANLPAVIEDKPFPKEGWFVLGGMLFAAVVIFALILGRGSVVDAVPFVGGMYGSMGLDVPPRWDGLVFEGVKSELKYDSGTMKLFVDGVIYNGSSDKKEIPDIKARAMGPDKTVVQSWWVGAPVAFLEPGGRAAFHTEVASSMERTIEDVYLEFAPRKDKGNDKK